MNKINSDGGDPSNGVGMSKDTNSGVGTFGQALKKALASSADARGKKVQTRRQEPSDEHHDRPGNSNAESSSKSQ